MDYETIFDIQNAYPQHWTGVLFGSGLILAFLLARFNPARLEDPEFRNRIVASIPTTIWPQILRPYLSFLIEMLVLSILDLLSILAPRWRWGIAFGLLILGLGVWQVKADMNQIAELLDPTAVETVEGPVTNIGSGLKFGHTQGYIEVRGHLFRYNKDDAGSPYWPTNLVVYRGQMVRVTYAGDHITRVERQLCEIYTHCTVRYLFGIRFESEKS